MASLGTGISLYTPHATAKNQLIILCAWLGAGVHDTARHRAMYSAIAPNTRLLLLTTDMWLSVLSSQQRQAVQPAVAAVRAALDEAGYSHANPAAPTQILLHLMSAGGVTSATHLLTTLHGELRMPLPLVGVICDSAPASASYWKRYAALRDGFPRSGGWSVLGPLLAHVIGVVVLGIILYHRVVTGGEQFRLAFMDEGLVKSERICYFASKRDEVVPLADVRRHAEEARGRGWQVKEVVFEDTSRVEHLAKYDGEYVECVRAMWEGSQL
ncbi:uncharacterized protein BDZ99DRAFT_533679 [Mytilinidion resinicola]|uniref:DUF829-domain-containing protein n=1 Tax=Mytilinidion resinicola TaxID=574789 RepID=A0A6A6YMN2_9PEZI|nr:uncharacterized protein BDZ99DRAFT_533679 [Mytilinidion resinicola]KAF2809127.1 hypothetical protein BDZ99DRAFT_533679 [Mytilinidion resinicola]